MEGIIRKIIIGDIKEGMTYKLDQVFSGSLQIIDIVHDIEAMYRNGDRKYDIYVKKRGVDNARLWKSFVNVPTSVEYDLGTEDETD
jgi:hypothetical protein